MKGVILAGGEGTRLRPLTTSLSKQLLPVFDKPLIYFPLTTLILAGIRELLVVCSPQGRPLLENLLGDGSQWSVSISYENQETPGGLAHGLLLSQRFVGQESFAFILGDNIFYGRGLGRALEQHLGGQGAKIFGVSSPSPERYGVVELADDGSVRSLEEKPEHPKSRIVVPGLYFFDETAFLRARSIEPSERGELEIIDLLKHYWKSGDLRFTQLPLGTSWLDCGTFESLYDAGTLVKTLQSTSGEKIGDPGQASVSRGWM